MKIIDNCTSHFIANEIEKIFLDQTINWLYDASTLGNVNADANTASKDSFQFIHPVLYNGRYDSPYTPLILELGNSILTSLDVHVLNYRRIKVNQLLKSYSRTEESHPAHIDDTAENMISIIYYINDSDGPTYFFDNFKRCVEKINPRKNRCVVFPSNRFHASSSPITATRRLVINYIASTDAVITI